MVHKCTICRWFEGELFKGPPPPPLPNIKIKEDPAFRYLEVDFDGPLFVRNAYPKVSVKVWIWVFTCTRQGRRTRYGRYVNARTGFRAISYYARANKINV